MRWTLKVISVLVVVLLITVTFQGAVAKHYEDPADLFQAADAKMYEAKRSGRNQVCF